MPLRIITLFLLLLPALTQSQNLQWVRQAGGVYETTPNVIWDIGEKTNIGMDGFQYSTGTFYQIAQFDGITISAPNPSLQMYLVQYDSSGNVQWAKQSEAPIMMPGNIWCRILPTTLTCVVILHV